MTLRRCATLVVTCLLVFLMAAPVYAKSWTGVVTQIEEHLDRALTLYRSGQVAEAKEAVNQAYFGAYEERGMETAVRLNLSAKRAATEEYSFSQLKSLMNKGVPEAEVQQLEQKLVSELRADAASLDGPAEQKAPASDGLSSFLIIVREGLEAILVLAALLAYLGRTGQTDRVRTVYGGALVALLASGATAVAFRWLLTSAGAAQEALEGVTMLLAAAVLLAVSFWLFQKAQARAWQDFIHHQLSKGSAMAIWWASFLAVYREGAETVLFYQALLAAGAAPGPVAAGLALGLVVLAAVFLLVRCGSLKIPLRPFFAITSFLLYYLAVVFAGKSVLELQAAGFLPATPVPWAPTVDWAGIFPTAESLGLQTALVLAAIAAIARIQARRFRSPL